MDKLFYVMQADGKSKVMSDVELKSQAKKVPNAIIQKDLQLLQDDNIVKQYYKDANTLFLRTADELHTIVCLIRVDADNKVTNVILPVKVSDLIDITVCEYLDSPIMKNADYFNELNKRNIHQIKLPTKNHDYLSFSEIIKIIDNGTSIVSTSGNIMITGVEHGKHNVNIRPGTILQDEIFFERDLIHTIPITYRFSDIGLKLLVEKNPNAKFTFIVEPKNSMEQAIAKQKQLEGNQTPKTAQAIMFQIFTRHVYNPEVIEKIMECIILTEFIAE